MVEQTICHCVVMGDGRTRLEPSYVERLRMIATPVLDCYPVRRAWLYGSAARGVYRPDSDIDIILDQVEGERGFPSATWTRYGLRLRMRLGSTLTCSRSAGKGLGRRSWRTSTGIG